MFKQNLFPTVFPKERFVISEARFVSLAQTIIDVAERVVPPASIYVGSGYHSKATFILSRLARYSGRVHLYGVQDIVLPAHRNVEIHALPEGSENQRFAVVGDANWQIMLFGEGADNRIASFITQDRAIIDEVIQTLGITLPEEPFIFSQQHELTAQLLWQIASLFDDITPLAKGMDDLKMPLGFAWLLHKRQDDRWTLARRAIQNFFDVYAIDIFRLDVVSQSLAPFDVGGDADAIPLHQDRILTRAVFANDILSGREGRDYVTVVPLVQYEQVWGVIEIRRGSPLQQSELEQVSLLCELIRLALVEFDVPLLADRNTAPPRALPAEPIDLENQAWEPPSLHIDTPAPREQANDEQPDDQDELLFDFDLPQSLLNFDTIVPAGDETDFWPDLSDFERAMETLDSEPEQRAAEPTYEAGAEQGVFAGLDEDDILNYEVYPQTESDSLDSLQFGGSAQIDDLLQVSLPVEQLRGIDAAVDDAAPPPADDEVGDGGDDDGQYFAISNDFWDQFEQAEADVQPSLDVLGADPKATAEFLQPAVETSAEQIDISDVINLDELPPLDALNLPGLDGDAEQEAEVETAWASLPMMDSVDGFAEDIDVSAFTDDATEDPAPADEDPSVDVLPTLNLDANNMFNGILPDVERDLMAAFAAADEPVPAAPELDANDMFRLVKPLPLPEDTEAAEAETDSPVVDDVNVDVSEADALAPVVDDPSLDVFNNVFAEDGDYIVDVADVIESYDIQPVSQLPDEMLELDEQMLIDARDTGISLDDVEQASLADSGQPLDVFSQVDGGEEESAPANLFQEASADLEARYETLYDQYEELQQKIVVREARIDDLSLELQALQGELEEAYETQQSMEQQQIEIAALTVKLREQEAELEEAYAMQRSLEDHATQVIALNESLQRLEQDLSTALQEQQSLRERHAELAEELKQVKDERQTLQNQLERVERHNLQLQVQVQEARQQRQMEADALVPLPPSSVLSDMRLFVIRLRERIARLRQVSRSGSDAHLLEQIISEANTAVELLSDVASVAQLDVNKFGDVDLTEVIEDVAVVVGQREVPGKVALRVDVQDDGEPKATLGERTMLLQALYNLVFSSMQLAVPESDVQLVLGHKDDDLQLSVTFYARAGLEEKLNGFMQHFNRGVPQRSGMALARTIIQQHQGTMLGRVLDEDNLTELIVRLPAVLPGRTEHEQEMSS